MERIDRTPLTYVNIGFERGEVSISDSIYHHHHRHAHRFHRVGEVETRLRPVTTSRDGSLLFSRFIPPTFDPSEHARSTGVAFRLPPSHPIFICFYQKRD
jgi:hypothetical protein